MLRFYADRFLRTSTFLAQQNQVIKVYRDASRRDGGLVPSPSSDFQEDYRWLHETLEAMGLRNSAKAAKRLWTFVKGREQVESSELEPLIDEVLHRMMDELETQLVLAIANSKACYFDDSTDVFPASAREAFPSAEYDMDEASKCFALERHTACVFHSMCVLEVGLNTLSRALDLPVGKTWNMSLDQIEKEIRSRSVRTHGEVWKTDEPFYSEAATHFRFVKNSWRNYVAHGKEHYDEERAGKILRSVGDFMRDIAGRLHE